MPRLKPEQLAGRPTVAGCALPGTAKIVLSVRQHHVDVLKVRMMNLPQLLEPAHPIGLLGAQQVPFAGMHSHDLSGRSDLEALGGAAMRF
jgi:hypothetical protein